MLKNDKKLNENQKIIIWCNREQGLEAASFYALYLALFLKKEVCFFANYRNGKEEARFRGQIDHLIEKLSVHLSNIPYSVLMLKGKLKNLSADLSNRYESILFCCPGELNFHLLQAFYRSRTPFLFTRTTDPVVHRFRRLIIPIDFRQSVKEAALWGSYFGRLNQSEISLFQPFDKDEDLMIKVKENMNSIVALYNKFTFQYSVEKRQVSSWKIHGDALDNATSSDLLVVAGSFNVSLPDYLIGPFERRLVNRSKNVPVLLINPQDETCVICD